MSTSLFLEPIDVWLFRDGRPFDAGRAHRAESLFPPYPTVIQGAIRTQKLVNASIALGDRTEKNMKAIAALVGAADSFGDLRLRGPFLARREKGKVVRYFPQPADAIQNKTTLVPAMLTESQPSTIKTGLKSPLHLLGLNNQSGKPGDSLWLSQNNLMDLLSGKEVEGVKSKDLFDIENRTGIGVGDRRVVNEGMLYEVGFVRPAKDVGLLVKMEGQEPNWQEPGILHLGGEKRMAQFRVEKTDEWPVYPEKTDRFKIYFATPAFFEKGWLPSDWGKFFNNPVELVGAAVNRFETIGGFNWIADPNGAIAHRSARRFISAGSVYYFKGSAQFKPGLLQQAITDFGAEIGFGQIIIKEW
jgi:CRISPR-associated protein Cmr3